jgi:hypothetical protein
MFDGSIAGFEVLHGHFAISILKVIKAHFRGRNATACIQWQGEAK